MIYYSQSHTWRLGVNAVMSLLGQTVDGVNWLVYQLTNNMGVHERHWTPLKIVKDKSSHLVYLHKITNLWKLNSIGHRSCEIITEEKTPLSREVVCFQMLDFRTSKPYSEVMKTALLQRELFLTMFYTINSSPIARYQKSFYANNYFEFANSVQCLKHQGTNLW